MKKIRQGNNLTDRIGLVYVKIEIELSKPIWPGAIFDENQIRQWCDRSYRCGLTKNETELSSPIESAIIYDENQIAKRCDWSMSKTIWNCHD